VGGFSYSSLAKELVAIAMKLFIQLFSSTTSSRGEKNTHTHTHTHYNGIGGRVNQSYIRYRDEGSFALFFFFTWIMVSWSTLSASTAPTSCPLGNHGRTHPHEIVVFNFWIVEIFWDLCVECKNDSKLRETTSHPLQYKRPQFLRWDGFFL